MATKKNSPVTFDTKKQQFLKDGKPITKRNRRYGLYVLHYVCGQVAQGVSLNDILPVEPGGAMPNIVEFMRLVNSSEANKKVYNEAKQGRFIMISEKLVQAVQVYLQDPTPENQEVLKALNATRTYLEKGLADQDSITIEVHSLMPKDFWHQSDWRVKGNENEKEK